MWCSWLIVEESTFVCNVSGQYARFHDTGLQGHWLRSDKTGFQGDLVVELKECEDNVQSAEVLALKFQCSSCRKLQFNKTLSSLIETSASNQML